MDTGKFQGILKEDGVTAAIPFDMGTGRVDLTQAGNAGLVLNETGANFNAANPATGGDPKTLNLASLANPACATACTWTRTVKATRAGTWMATYITPAGMTLQVTPSTFTLAVGQTQQLNVQANVSGLPTGTYAFGYVVLTENPTEAGETIHLTVAVNPVPGQATITVNPSSLSATQVTNTTTSQTLTIGNTGTTNLSWSIAEAPVALRLPTGVSRGTQQAAALRQVTIGDATLSHSTLTPGQQVTPQRPETPDNLVTITHSASQSIVSGNSVACGNVAGGYTAENSYLREFDLAAFGISSAFNVTAVEFGVELASAGSGGTSQPLNVRLYTKINPAGALTWANLSPIGSATVNIANQNLTLFSVPLAGSAPAGSVLVVEVNLSDGQPLLNRFYVGSNAAGQTAPGYIAASACGISQPTSLASIGYPDMHIVMNVTGNAQSACTTPSDVPWLSETPTSGNSAAGSSSNVTVGFDSTGLAVGTYNATLCVNSNDPTTPLVEVPVSLTVEGGQPPNIDVSPASLSSTQATNTTTQQTLNVGNTGGNDLTWTVFEDATGGAPELVDWSDNFDSYATGSQLHGQGGWKGWSNDPAAGTLASNAQARSAPNSAAILDASDLVHEYAETEGQWVYTAWQYLPVNFTGESYFILLNTYNDAGSGLNWSTQPCFDAASGLLYDDIPGDCSGTSTLPLVTGQWMEIRVEIDLDADTQAIYYNNQLLVQDTWSGHVSGAGATTIAAVDLFANSASTVYYDDLSLVASTQAVACDAPADIPWVSVSPTNGTTPAAGSSPVTVTFNSTGLANGTYTGNLCVGSNDPDAGPGNGTDLVIVPMTLTVQEPTAVTLSGLAADDTSPAPMPVSVPMSALPAAVAAAFAVVVALRRRR